MKTKNIINKLIIVVLSVLSFNSFATTKYYFNVKVGNIEKIGSDEKLILIFFLL